MISAGKRLIFGRGKGYLTAAGSQARFIVFLIIILVSFTLLLKVFQKLAEIVALPIFLPISLITLLAFIGIVGTLYSHKFVGPMQRIRNAIDQLSEGDTAVSLRLRESDDPMLKDLVRAIGRACDHGRVTHILIQETAGDLFQDIEKLSNAVNKGSSAAELRKHLEELRKKQEFLNKAIQSYRKA